MRRFLTIFIVGAIAVFGVLAGLFLTFVNTQVPRVPKVTSPIVERTIEAGGRTRDYLLYVPKAFKRGAPLMMALHGSGQDATQMRIETGYAFERLAEKQGFAIVYPNGVEGYWNACNVEGDYAANKLDIDDVGFLSALARKIARDIGTGRTFAMGISRGGHMAFRLALEAPKDFDGLAAVAANLPVAANFKCRAPAGGTPSVMIMNGTADPLNPFEGGEVQLFGLMKRGLVRSARDSAAYFAQANGLSGAGITTHEPVSEGYAVDTTVWQGARTRVALVAIVGGGHSMPQRWRRVSRILGPTAPDPDGAEVIMKFFTEQK